MNRIGKLMVLALGLWTGVANAVTATSNEARLDCRTGDRVSAGTEELTFSNLWDGDADATVTIAQDGAAIFTGLTGEGVKTWTVDHNGRYVLTHTTYTNGVAGKVETAVFVVEGKEVPVGELTIDWGEKSFVYDGLPKEPVVTVKEGDLTLTNGVNYAVSYLDNVNVGTARVIVDGIGYYTGSLTNTFTITAASMGGEDDEEPGRGEIPEGGLSKFDRSFVYDGDGHTFGTNELFAAFDEAVTGAYEVAYGTSSSGPWSASAPVYTNVGEYVVWYKVTNPNYQDFVHSAKVTITKASVAEPVIADLQYTGKPQKPTVPASDRYGVTYNMGGTEVNAPDEPYMVMLTLTDSANWKWSTTDDAYVMINYNIIPATNEWTVEPSITGWTYGDAPSVPVASAKFGSVTVSYKGTANDGTVYDGAVGVTKAGDYTAVFAVPPTESYSGLTSEVAFVVAARSIIPPGPTDPFTPGAVLAVTNYAGVYDGVGHGISVHVQDVYDDIFTVEYGPTAEGPWNAILPVYTNVVATGTYYRVTAPNYEPFAGNASVAISPRPVTVTVVGHSESPFYDTTEKTVSGYDISTEDPLYDAATMTTFSGTAVAKRTDVGTTSMGLVAEQFANTDANFAVTYDVTDGGVTIVSRAIGDDDANWDIRLDKAPMYNGEEQTAPIIQVCYVKPDGNLDYIPYELLGNVATNAGNYKVKIVGKGNYSGSVEKDWAIMPRNVTLKSGTAVWEYDGATHVTNVVEVTGDGFVDGEGATYSDFPQVTHVADAATPLENAFTYTLNENTKAQNYVINVVKGTVTMTKRPITLTAPTKSKTYDGTALTFGAEEIGETYAGATGGAAGVRALPAGESFVYSNFASITEAGQVAAMFAIADGTALMTDYEITVTPGATLTVTKSATEITVTAKNGEWTYDGATHTLHEYEAANLDTLIAGDELEVAFDEASAVTTPVDGQVPNTITGVRVIRGGTDDVSSNYTLAWYPGTLTVKKRPVTLKSKDASKVYDGTPLVKHEVEVGGDGFVGDDGASYEFTGLQTDKGKSKNAFTYTLNEGTNAAYYDITPTEGELEVFAADIGEAEDGDWQVVLGPALTYTGIAQVQTLASVTLDGLVVDYSIDGNQQTDAGEYEMTLIGQGNFTGKKKVAWSIAPKALTLTAGSGTKVYDGAALTVGTVTADGFVANETATFVCTGSQLDVGSSENAVGTITWTAAKASNYSVTKNPGTLAVTARPVVVKSKNISKPYDGTPLTLTAADISESYTGGAAGVRALPEGESFVYSGFASRTEAGQTSATFSIAAGANTKLSNYAITPAYGTITVTKSATEIGVTAASETWTYDGDVHSNRTWTATNLDTLQAGDELVVTFDDSSVVTTPRDGFAQDGVVENAITSVRVIRGGVEDVTANYTVTPYPGVLKVVKRPVAVTVVGHVATNVYDSVEHAVSGYEISTSDELYDIAADTSFTGADTVSRTDVGSADMGLSASDFENGNENFTVTYAVTDGRLVIEAADITVGDGADFVLSLGANPKYNGTVQTVPVTAVTYKGLPVTYTLAGEVATHAGTYTLTVKANGNFTGERSTTWQVLKRQVVLTSVGAFKIYDGTPLRNDTVNVSGDGFIGAEGAAYAVTGAQTAVGTSKNAFTYTLNAGTLAGDYDISTVFGDLVVARASLPSTDDPDPVDPSVDPEDPEQREDPDVRFSAFDYVGVYDGDEHTIDTNALKAAYETAFGESVTIGYMDDASGAAGVRALPPIVRDAAVTSFWYKVSSANYNDVVKPCKIAITNRAVTLTSASQEWTYDGAAHSAEEITFGGMGFVAGEGVTTNGFATITNVGTAPNAFAYAFASGTKAENYVVTCVTGTLSVVKAALPQGEDPDPIDPGVDPEDPEQRDDPDVRFSAFDYVGVYDGDEHTIDTNALKAAYETALGESVTIGYMDDASGAAGVRALPPIVVDAAVTSFWYKVSSANYNDIVHPCKVAITNRAVTLTSASQEWTYDGAAHSAEAITIGGMGFVAGEGVTTNGFATITNVGTAPNVFEYAFASGTKAENYVVTCVTGTLSVVKAALPPVDDPDPIDPVVDPEDPEQREDPDVRFSAFDYVGVYDGEAHTIDTNALKAAYETVFGESVTIGYIDDASGAAGVRALPPIVRDVAVTSFWYKVSSANYNDVVHPCKIAITNRAVTVTVVGHSISPFYDTTEKTVSGYDISTEDELYDVATMTTFSGTAVAKRTDVGTTSMGLKAEQFANTDANFAVTYDITDGGVTIVSRAIGDDDANWDIRLDKAPTYNGAEQSAPIIQVCYVKPDGNLDYIPYDLEGNVATNAGNYKVKIIGKGNYSGTVEKDWAIMPRNVTLTSGTAVWEYDGETHVTNVVEVTGDGFVDGEGATYADFPRVTHVADAATPLENAFTYTLNENTKAQNYVINVVKGTVMMTKRPITLTAPTKSKTYDGTALTFGAEEIGETYAGATGGAAGVRALPAGESFVYSNFASITEAGQVAAMFTIADGTALMADYEITVTPGATLTVTKSATEITVTAKNGEWTYDGATHTLHEYEAANLDTLIAGDELEVTFDETSVVTTPVDGEGHNGQVPNTITGVRVIRRGAEDVSANYTLAWYPGTLTVKKRPVTLKSKDASKTYDGTPLVKHEVEIGGDGFVGDDGASYEFTGMQTDKGKSKNAFTYTLNEGTNAAYYDITPTEGELEVFAADIGEAEDDDWQVVLGPALTYNGIAQVQTLASVTLKGLTVDYSVVGNQQTDAGEYEMTLTGQGNFTGEKKVAWSIAPKALTLTARSGSKVYDGAALSVGTVTAAGFVANEEATFVCIGSQLDVGSSENTVGTITWTAAKAANYAVTKKPGTLTVTARPVTVTSKNISKPYDGTPLMLTAGDISESYTGGAAGVRALPDGESFVYGDFASRTEAGQTSGTFSVAAGVNTKLSNYAITPVYGTITIAKSATEIGVTAASETWTYDGAIHSNRTWTATNLDILQSGEEVVVTFKETSVVTTPKDGPAADGKVANEIDSVRILKDGTQDVTGNYTVTPYPGLLTVEKRPVTVLVTGKTVKATYDGEEHTASGYDISTEDELYDIAAKTSFNGAAEVKRTDVGKTEMGLKAEDFANSDENFEVTYSVTDGSVEIEPADITIGAEEDFVLTLAANPKYNGTVQTIPVTAVTYKGLPVTCDLAGENATHAGTYTLTVKAKGNFSGERSVTWQVLKRQVTLTSGSATRAYNGQPLVNGTVTVSGDGFIGVEGATFETSGSQTEAGSSKNTFTYTLKAGTLAGDYEITKVEGDLTVTKATFDPHSVFPELVTATEEDGILCERVFNGKPQPFEVEVSESFTEAYEILYAVTPGVWSSVAPTLTDVSDGDLKVFFRFVSSNFEPYEGFGTLRIVQKELTDEMVQPGEDAFFFDGEDKKPTVDVVYDVDGYDVCTPDDYTLEYGEKADTGWWVTVTGKDNYSGTVTKIVPVLKRPVAPPVVPSKAYNGKNQKPTIPTDERWTVVANPGGTDAGEYTNVVLRLTDTANYKWKGGTEEDTDVTLVFKVTKANNGWSRNPDMKGWEYGQTPSEPNMGQARYGTVQVAYRKAGTDVSTETSARPELPGKYIARFWADETENYIGVAVNTHKEIEFEITGTGPAADHTLTTPEPVPYKWLEPYLAQFAGGKTGEAGYETAGNASGVNGVALWESYVAGLDPTDALSRFTGKIKMSADDKPIVSWQPALNGETSEGAGILKGERVYRIHGKVNLDDAIWTPDIDPKGGVYRFYKITVELPKE